MKIRTDFVTNSSSSSFTLEIEFKLVNGNSLVFCGHGAEGDGAIDYFNDEAIVRVSPKQLATAKTVEEMIQLLIDGVLDGDDGWEDVEPRKIFLAQTTSEDIDEMDEEDMDDAEWDDYIYQADDASFFVDRICENIKSMDEIESVSITGNEENYVSYLRTYIYNRKTGKYTCSVVGDVFECNGSSCGDLQFYVEG